MIEVHMHPYTHYCDMFIDKNGKRYKRRVLIAPIRTSISEDGSVTIAWACSLAPSCHNKECRYAKGEE